MPVILNAIQFNHDPLSSSQDAFNIRRNFAQVVPLPEWQRGSSTRARDSLAAYAIEETRGKTIIIKAQFFCDEPQAVAEVRAVQPAGSAPNVLGEVAPGRVFFVNGHSELTPFVLRNVRIWTAGIGIHEVQWQWQFRFRAGDPWRDIRQTEHVIYTVLALPTAPWQQFVTEASATQLPWTDVMDFACQWANGVADRDAAAALVTAAVFSLGTSGVIAYDCVNLDGFGGDFIGSPHYTALDPFSLFDCTLFLDRLRGGLGAGPFVNCSDCAAMVSTFSNILGCDLWQSRMGYFFAVNPFLAVGAEVWERACGNFGSFLMHEVAWKNACTAFDNVFDGCLAVDASGHPGIPPPLGVLPMNMPFGFVGQAAYRAFLAAPVANGQPLCNPQPQTRQRRVVL